MRGGLGISICSLLSALSACGQNIFYYQNDGLKLKLQARPSDASQPIQGTLAFKERVALVVPQKEDGQAYSLVSGFSFDKEDKDSNGDAAMFGALHIRSSLVTGDAAIQVATAGETSKLAVEVANVSGRDIPTSSDLASRIVKRLNDSQKQKLEQLESCPEDSASASVTAIFWDNSMPPYYKELCEELRKKLSE